MFEGGSDSVVEKSAVVGSVLLLQLIHLIRVQLWYIFQINDVSVAVVGESDTFADLSVPVISFSVVFDNGSDSVVDNSVVVGSVTDGSSVVFISDDGVFSF